MLNQHSLTTTVKSAHFKLNKYRICCWAVVLVCNVVPIKQPSCVDYHCISTWQVCDRGGSKSLFCKSQISLMSCYSNSQGKSVSYNSSHKWSLKSWTDWQSLVSKSKSVFFVDYAKSQVSIFMAQAVLVWHYICYRVHYNLCRTWNSTLWTCNFTWTWDWDLSAIAK